MTLGLLLPWFPILLGAGIGGRLLGRTRGLALGVLCALFWLVLIQASAGPGLWRDIWAVATVMAGGFAITAIAAWAGEMASEGITTQRRSGASAGSVSEGAQFMTGVAQCTALTSILVEFDQFLETALDELNPWSKFDDFIRRTLFQTCRATHVRPYRVSVDGEVVLPLTEPSDATEAERPSAVEGVFGHVLRTGRSFVAGDHTVATGPDGRRGSRRPPAWCFAISRGLERVGVVSVGQLDIDPQANLAFLHAIEKSVSLCWSNLIEACRSKSATTMDPVTGTLTREAFLVSADSVLSASYVQSEPAAVAVIALEGLRDMNDSGRWEVSDELLHEVGQALRQKVRPDDRVGRFDGSRFVMLLRRVDTDLANLIVAQLVTRISGICGDRGRWRSQIAVRAGVAMAHEDKPTIRSLVTSALSLCHKARQEHLPMASSASVETAVGVGV